MTVTAPDNDSPQTSVCRGIISSTSVSDNCAEKSNQNCQTVVWSTFVGISALIKPCRLWTLARRWVNASRRWLSAGPTSALLLRHRLLHAGGDDLQRGRSVSRIVSLSLTRAIPGVYLQSNKDSTHVPYPCWVRISFWILHLLIHTGRRPASSGRDAA